MAETKEKRGADVPLALAQGSPTRDALTDPRPGDYVPDLKDKGLHVGEVRQPAELVLTEDGDLGYESIGNVGASKFKEQTYAEQVAATDARLSGNPAYAGVPASTIETDPEKVAKLKAAQGQAKRSKSSEAAEG